MFYAYCGACFPFSKTFNYAFSSIIIVGVFLSLLTSALQWQNECTFHFGVSGGIQNNATLFSGTDTNVGGNGWGYEFGFDVYYDLSPRVQLVSGGGVKSLRMVGKYFSLRFGQDLKGMGQVTMDRTYWLESEAKVTYLMIPVNVRIKLLAEKPHLYVRRGFDGLFRLTTDQNSFVVESAMRSEPLALPTAEERVQNFVLSAGLGLGYEFQLANRFKVFIEPDFGFSLTEISDQFLLFGNTRIWDAGLRTGARF